MRRSTAGCSGGSRALTRQPAVNRAIPMDENISAVVAAWGSDKAARLVFKIRMFAHKLLQSEDSVLKRLLYVQCVYRTAVGIHDVDESTAAKLAALHFLDRFGSYDPTVCVSAPPRACRCAR